MEMAMYASEKKNPMMSRGEIPAIPMVPSCTSCLPIAVIASRNRSAINGAVMKFNKK